MNKRRIILITILVQAIIILGLVFYSGCSNKTQSFINVDLSKMESDIMTYEDGTWVLSDYETTEQVTVALRGPYINLSKGSYTATVYATGDGVNAVQLNSDSDNSAIISSNSRLESSSKATSFHFEISRDISDFELAILYTGKGNLTISNIDITSDNYQARRVPVIVFLIFLITDLIYAFSDKIWKNKLVSSILLSSIVIESACLIIPGIVVGHDFPIHLMRIEGIVQELINGNFPSRMQSIWIGGYGYPISIFYGDWSLYFPALLRLSGFSITSSWKLFILANNILTTIVSYFCFKKIFGKELNAAICTLCYTLSAFRLVDIYVRSTAGEITAFIFLPVIAMAIYGIYRDNIKDKKYNMNALYLGIGMAGLITSHLFTSEFTAIILVTVALIFFKKTFRKETLVCYLMSVITAVLCSLGFLIPFIDYFIQVPVVVKNPLLMAHTTGIQSSGARIYQYFDYFGDFFVVMNDDSKRMNMSPGLILMVILIVSMVLFIMKKTNKRAVILTILAVGILFLSSELFPWNLLEKISPTFTSIQFPWRFIGLSVIILSLLLGEVMELTLDKKTIKYALIFCLVVSIFVGGLFVYRYKNTSFQVSNYIDTASLNDKNVSGGEYIIQGTDLSSLIYEEERESDTITFPVFNYPYYEVTDSDGNSYEIKNGTNNRIAVEVPSDFEGQLYVRFEEPVLWRISEVISLLSLAGVVICLRKDSLSH